MNPVWIGLAAFASVTILAWGIAYFVNEFFLRYRSSLNERLDGISDKDSTPTNVSPLFKVRREFSIPSVDARPSLADRWNSLLEQSASRMTLPRMTVLSVGTGVALMIVPIGLTRLWWAGIPAFICGLLGPLVWLLLKRRRRINRLCQQLPEAFDVMSRVVRAGQTIPASFQTIADDFEAPISGEFRCCYEEQNLGIAYETALRNLARRTGVMELQILVVALLVHGRSGGNLVQLLQGLSTMVRKRHLLAARVKTLTSEGRMQAVVLMILPLAAFVVLWFISPNYIGALLNRPWLLTGTLAAQGLGVVWIRRIVQIEY